GPAPRAANGYPSRSGRPRHVGREEYVAAKARAVRLGAYAQRRRQAESPETRTGASWHAARTGHCSLDLVAQRHRRHGALRHAAIEISRRIDDAPVAVELQQQRM